MSRLIYFILILCSFFYGCGGDDMDSEFYFRGNLDGIELTTDVSISQEVSNLSIDYLISGLGLNEEGLLININLESPASVGVFSTSEMNVVFLIAEGSEFWSATSLEGEGTVEIIENTTEFIRGTCSFTAINSSNGLIRNFTNGRFRSRKM